MKIHTVFSNALFFVSTAEDLHPAKIKKSVVVTIGIYFHRRLETLDVIFDTVLSFFE